jgi:hypothetical protein
MNITGYRALGIGANNPVDRNSQNRQLSGDLTWIRGRHTVKTGMSFLRSQNPIFNIRNTLGAYTFNGAYSGDGAADFLLGVSSQWAWQSPVTVSMRAWSMGGFVQDDWKLGNKLTVNLGLRYELSPPWYERNNKMGIFDIDTTPGQASLVYARGDGSRADRALVATDTNNFMPRIGFAYKLTDKTVLRSGYGLFYAYMENMGDSEFLIGNAPFAYGVTLTGSNTVPALRLAAGPAAGATDLARATGLQFSSYERKPPMSAAHQWNMNVQREVGQDWLMEVGYSGSRGLHLVRQYDANFSPADVKRALKEKREPSYMGTFTGARAYVLHTFSSTQSAMMKRRVARYMASTACAACEGKRLKRASLSVTFAGFSTALRIAGAMKRHRSPLPGRPQSR